MKLRHQKKNQTPEKKEKKSDTRKENKTPEKKIRHQKRK